MNERELEFQRAVIETARLSGWRVAHFRPARTEHGWRTPVEADGAGFPDLVLLKRGRCVFVELKSGSGKVTREQAVWLDELSDTPNEVYVWRPQDWDELLEVLTGREVAA